MFRQRPSGLPNFRTRDQRATNPWTHLQNKAGNVGGAPLMTDVGRRSADDWFADIKMRLWLFVDKMDGE